MESNKIVVTEEMHPEQEWFEQAREQTPETLMNFINHVMNDYVHDYGTVVHAISACAIAAASAANETPGACGGITGFQAGFVMWDFIKNWNHMNNVCGMRLINYDDMLYPQCEYRFEKAISASTWDSIQKEAKKRLEERPQVLIDHIGYNVHPTVIEHWKSIVAGHIPFGYICSSEEVP